MLDSQILAAAVGAASGPGPGPSFILQLLPLVILQYIGSFVLYLYHVRERKVGAGFFLSLIPLIGYFWLPITFIRVQLRVLNRLNALEALHGAKSD
ncbi:MAG: hypothetical protein PVI23_06295 [Maricaulaceae bacterium]|jgi:hypothetical protein